MKANNNKQKVLFLGMAAAATLFAHSQAFAIPTKFPTCSKNIQLRSAPNSNGYVFNEDCSVVYVLPPLAGSLSISGYSPSANLDAQCSRLKTIEQDQLKMQQTISIYTQRVLQYAKRIQEIEENLSRGLVPYGKTVEDMQAEVDSLLAKSVTVRSQILAMQQQNDEQKLQFSKAEGGRGVFVLQSSFDELVRAYSKANPGIHFEPITVDLGFMTANEQRSDASTAAQMPAVLSLKLVGLEKMPLMLDPGILLQHPEFAPQTVSPGTSSKIFGGALPGEIQISNIGACALREAVGNRDSFSFGEVKNYIAAAATYSYQLQVTRRHSIKYSLQELVRQIREQTRKSGFFNRSTLDSLVDERRSNAWITFEVESQDQRFEYTDEYVRDVKKEFISRALAQVVALQTGSSQAVLSLIDPSGKNGATVSGEELGKCPHLYCQIGAAGFRVLASIFSSETATTSLLKTFDVNSAETVTEKRMVPAYGTSVFR